MFLKRPSAYGNEARRVRAIETHFAWVFLAGRGAFKLKKPLRHRQLDYRTLASRQHGCLEEVRLNRRLAPMVYEGVVPLRWADGRLSIDGRGEIVDWLVRMKRLPDAKMLDNALRRGAVGAEHINRIATALAVFYASAPVCPVPPRQYVWRLARDVKANLREICRYTDKLTQRLATEVAHIQKLALDSLRAELSARGACVVEGHGDLRAEHLYIGRPTAVIDALEFDRRLRLFDPVEEVCLLALEIERLGRRTLADRLIDRLSGEVAPALDPRVFAFYKSHRAATRAKLAAWHIGDPQFPDAAPWIARTDSLLADALRYAREAAGLAEALDGSVSNGRPAVQQRSERRAGDHAAHGFGEEWGHMQFR
jgi:aminoglycoside phosphotransferase family enzyme